ncbi:MAG: hypothetical protein H6R17_1157 [Proteobacteria bacterium]|nr:hypothetical protein [Pseudomonadota bacterium]
MKRRALCAGMALIGALGAPACAQELGRLFFTPEQRQALDRRRQLNIQERQDVEDPTLTINGVVTRSSGKRTVWINGVAQSEVPSGATVITADRRDPGQVLIESAGAPAVKARVGDTINRNSGEATGLLGGGSIKPGRPLAAGPK